MSRIAAPLVLVLAALALAPAAAPAAAAARTAAASPKTVWLCKPGMRANPCTPSLSTTLFSGWDHELGVIHPTRARHPRADCFYVYPTVSDQQTVQADLRVDPELRSIALYQVSRYSQVCRVFAPVYRQVTLPALFAGKFTASASRRAYKDVLAAWKDYLAHYNRGRPFVLIGHSQGAGQLQQLIRAHVDRVPRVRARMLSAILLGGNVTVRKGRDVGGVFRNVPACRRATQLRCVIAFSTFNETPPANSIFGRSNGQVGDAFGLPSGPGYEVLCTNPARLRGGSATLDSISPTAPFAPGTLIAAGIELLGFRFPQAPTTYIESRGAFSGRCVHSNGANVLMIRSLGSTPVPKPSPDATWGLHLIDANVAQGDLLRVVKSEIGAYPRG